MAQRISADYEGKNLFVIVILKGSFVFAADLIRQLTVPCQVDFMSVSSYGNQTTTSGNVRITKDLTASIEDRDVLVVEDILDSGVTLSNTLKILGARSPRSIELCTLLDKPARRQAQVTAKYIGREVPDAFVVGYGLDYAEMYRDLPCVGILKREIYET
ncbi:MAG: hypoxanthine phosphoribosyltransferase [Clostridia bacterium]|nr:hypoxanthine phosphoribosyltransferase [Clostridia bacterium]